VWRSLIFLGFGADIKIEGKTGNDLFLLQEKEGIIMKIPVGNRISTFQGAVQPMPVRTSSASSQQKEKTTRRFDKVTISGTDTGHNSFAKMLTGRIAQDVRAATTTGTLSELQHQIEAGEYQPDPASIARKMLFLEEA